MPWQFWRLTPRELERMLRGARRRNENQRELVAWAVAHVMNATGRLKKPTSAAKLLGRVIHSGTTEKKPTR